MELRDYIKIGSEKAGSLTALGKMLDLSQPTISGVKAHKRALPIDAATKLADYIGADLRAVIAANELVTEKKEEKKNYWMQFIGQTKTAAYMIIALSVTNLLTPSPAEAAPLTQTTMQVICIMLSYGLKQLKLFRFFRPTLNHLRQLVSNIPAITFPAPFKLGISQMQA